MILAAENSKDHKAISDKIFSGRYQSRQPLIYGWVQQIKKAIQAGKGNPQLLRIIGNALIVINPDADELQKLLMSAANSNNGQYINLNIDQFLEHSEHLASELVPTFIFIEPSNWLSEEDKTEETRSLRSQVCTALKEFHTRASPVFVVTYTQRFSAIAEQFRHREAFDRHIFWAAPNPVLIAQDLYVDVGAGYFEETLLENPERLGRLLSLEFGSTRRMGMLAKALTRRAVFQDRKIGWRDLLEIAANGTGEGLQGNEYIELSRIATHETGHAVVSIVGSDLKNLPDMVTIVHGNGTSGVVVESFDYNYETRSGNLTLGDVSQRIRVCLAGRAAEELEYGLEGCGAYASQDDVENASRMALEMVMQNGFPAELDNPEASGSNLFSIPDGCEFGETKYYDLKLREFLEKLYSQTKTLLKESRGLFELIRAELIRERYLMRGDLERILVIHRRKMAAKKIEGCGR